MPILGVIDSAKSGNLYAASYESIATITGTSGSLTFSSIPSTYKHLQVRAMARSANAVAADQTMLYINGDASPSNFTFHTFGGNGSSAFSEGYGTGVLGGITPVIRMPGASTTANIFGVTVIDILDYTNTSKYKTVKALNGFDANGTGQLQLTSGLWLNTAAVNSLTFIIQGGGNFASGTTFSLYGIKEVA
jgi:hypothetical protein